jgi:glycosyltransferase involved in cell wall biosynthesis
LKLHSLARRAQRLIWNTADCVLPVTRVLARAVAAYGVPASRIAVIPNGINRSRFSVEPDNSTSKRALGLSAKILLGFVGFVRSWNAAQRIIDFVAEHSTEYDLHFLIVGDGPARIPLLKHARARNVAGRVTVTGVVPRDDVPGYIAAFDIAVLPGVTPYSSPLKLLEYMYFGRAVVAPDTENIREILTHEHDALLFDPAHPGAMGKALLRLCGDPGLRARIGAQARRTIDEKSLTWSHNATRVIELAEAALRERARQ